MAQLVVTLDDGPLHGSVRGPQTIGDFGVPELLEELQFQNLALPRTQPFRIHGQEGGCVLQHALGLGGRQAVAGLDPAQAIARLDEAALDSANLAA